MESYKFDKKYTKIKGRSLEENYMIYLKQNYKSFITVATKLEFKVTSFIILSLSC